MGVIVRVKNLLCRPVVVVYCFGLVASLAPCRADAGAKERYIDIMDRAFEAYGEQGARAYFDKVRKSGLTEHGFPRLSADLAILVAHGKRTELKPLMEDMMGFCCKAMNATNRPKGTGNDFSVRELVCAILELEKASAASPGKTAAWRAELSRIEPVKCYDCIALDASVPVSNWAMFNAGSEMARVGAGITTWEKVGAYVDRQIGSQMLAFIPEGLYRDPHWPMLYDVVGRMTLAFALHFGYNGRYRAQAEGLLMRAAPIALKMQSVTGEMPFGGRSNQFLHNEAWMALQFEYYAAEFAKRGDMKSAGQCKDAATLAVDAIFRWLDAVPGRHVKNRWPKGSQNGCEGYGYFDKYMITLASFAYAAYMMAEDSITPVPCPARVGGYVMKAPDPFHKVFANAGGYFLEFDTAADVHYDASGLGRVQKVGAPEIICLSVPFPGPNASYGVTPPNSRPVAIGAPPGAASHYSVDRAEMDGAAAVVEMVSRNGFIERYRVTGDGVEIVIRGQETCRVPVLETDGTEKSRIDAQRQSVTVFWHGWKCEWTTEGRFEDVRERYSNRNGTYRLFVARGGDGSVSVRIRILPDAGVTAHSNERPGPGFVVAENGALRADIVIPAKPIAVERYAAEELKHHLDRAFGASAEIVTEGAASGKPVHFYVGATKAAAAAGLPGRELKPDERLLRTVGDGLCLMGRDSESPREAVLNTRKCVSRGTLYAVYDFLETEMGVNWIWPGETGEVIPKRKGLSVGTVSRGGGEPLFARNYHIATLAQRSLIGFSSRSALKAFCDAQDKFLVRHRVGRNRSGDAGGHAFDNWWKRFGKEHPEYFNLLPDGKRRPFSGPDLVTMCVSQPGLWKQKVADWQKAYSMFKGPDSPEPWVICCENDFAGLCQCPACRAWDPPDPRFAQSDYWNGTMTGDDLEKLRAEKGAFSLSALLGANRWSIPKEDTNFKPVAPLGDRYANFYNHVLAEARKVNPAARVKGYAYANYVEGPQVTKVDPGVMIEFVPRSYFPYDATESAFFRKTWAQWRDAGTRDFILRPNFTLAGGNYLFDQGRLILDDFAFAYTNGMRGCSFDSLLGAWSAHALAGYALTRAFRDPLHGYDAARAEMVAAFGKAGPAIAQYLDAVREQTTRWSFADVRRMAWRNNFGRRGGGSFPNCEAILGDFFDDAFFPRMNAILDEAVAAADGDADAVARVEFLRKGLRDTELTRRTRIAQKALDADPENAAMKAAFTRAVAEMERYRISVEGDFVCDFSRAARRERQFLSWPCELREKPSKKTKPAHNALVEE